jgi:hypothetical protein
MGSDAAATTSSAGKCERCGESLVPLEDVLLFVERPCAECGKPTFRENRDPKTGGVRIEKGDRPHMSIRLLREQIKLSKGVRFSREGLDVFARSLFLPQGEALREPQRDLVPALEIWADIAEKTINAGPLFAGLDLSTVDGGKEAVARVQAHPHSLEAFAVGLDIACDTAKEALAAGDMWSAAGASATAAAFNALLMFKKEIEETVWRGHSVEVLRSAVQVWQSNALNDDEEFWQRTLGQYSFVLAQVFAAPVVILSGKAYVGGKSVENTGGNIADFLFHNQLTDRTALVELKTPTTPLLTSRPYRNGVFSPSPDVTGAVAQVSSYAAKLAEDVMLRMESKTRFDPARSECVVVVGTAATELADADQRRSFELYRSELRNVRVVTYDELFAKVATLLSLFGG